MMKLEPFYSTYLHVCSTLVRSNFFFHLVNREIRKDTIKRDITERTFTSFSQRVKILIQIIPKRTINCVIDSKDKWIKMVLRA